MPEAAGQAELLPTAPSASCPASASLSQGPVTFLAWPCSELAGGRTGMSVLKWGLPFTAPRRGGVEAASPRGSGVVECSGLETRKLTDKESQ